MHELKRLSREAVGPALEKAERYRLLNEPVEAESICRDVLAIEPENQAALVTLVLALSDQLEESLTRTFEEARAALARLDDEYARRYYGGILCERRAKAHWRRRAPGCAALAATWFRDAMEHYEAAIALRRPGNDDPILRWNTCARILAQHPELAKVPESDERVVELLE
jgi:hypothetical protein